MSQIFYPSVEAYRKMKFAELHHTAVYIYGATGFGKTRLWQEYLKNYKKVILSPVNEEWDNQEIEDIVSTEGICCIVLDDMQLLRNEEQKKHLLRFMDRKDIWLIMAGRMETPQWFIPQIAKGKLIVIDEDDLCFTVDSIMSIAESEDVSLDYPLAEKIAREGQGNALMALYAINLIKTGDYSIEQLTTKMQHAFVSHLEKNIIPQWDVNLQEFLMQISVVDSFSLPLAIMITGDDQAALMIEKALSAGNFIIQKDELYCIRPQLLNALRSRALKIFGMNEYLRCKNTAGLYYETKNNYIKALEIYEETGNKEGIRRLLIRNARRHMGNGSYYDLRKFYLACDEEEVEKSPILMSTLSMLYSVMMNPEESERWYQKLKAYAQNTQGGAKREVNEQILYLDIALPHRGNVNLIDTIKRTVGLLVSGGIHLAEFSLTNNQPSTMNGGKDFCEWSKRDQFLASTIGPMVETLLGKFGKGIIHAALCESFYEKGGRDEEVLRHALFVQMAVESGGRIELLFATVGIQIRHSIISGHLSNAIQLLDSFEQRVRKEQKMALIPNIEALRCRIALIEEDKNKVREWMKSAPDENAEFWSLDRYRYLTKVRCYLALGQNHQAIALLERLVYYSIINQRTYIRMESKLLLSIALRREKREWKGILLEAINEIQDYLFVRIISEKGAAIYPLLKEIRKQYLDQEHANKEWFLRVLKETQSQAKRYPGYISPDTAKLEDFGETAIAVLKMQSEGMTMKEIAKTLYLSERTVKYHATENYHKLGAKGKVEAIQIAQSLNLL